MSASLAIRPTTDVSATNAGPTIEGYPGDESTLLGMLTRYFEESEDASYDARQMAEKCRDYFDGRQWTPEEIAILRARRQPPVVNNYVKRKVELLRGLERRGRSDPKAFPRTPTEDNRADAATQALRYIADDQRYDVIRSSVFDNVLIEGVGGCEVIVEKDKLSGGYNVIINHLTWDRLFFDPHSAHPGFTDSRYIGIVIWKDRDEALDEWPGCEDILNSTFDAGRSNTFDDKPNHVWSDSKRRRLRVVQIWWKRKQDWWTATYTKGGFLEGPLKSPYMDRHGNATCPIILRSAYTDRDLQRYGVVKDLISPQDQINKRESKLMHQLAVNQVIMEAGMVDDVDKIRAEAAKPDGVMVIERPGGRFEINNGQAEVAGQFQLLQHAVMQMNVTGPNASMAGKDPREQSGRAIIAQQAGGQVEHEPIADALRQHTHKVFEAVWARVKQFWTDEKWVRVTDNDRNVRFVGLNHKVTIQDLLDRLDKSQPLPMQLEGLTQQDQQAVMIGMKLPPGHPALQMVVRVENDVSDMDVDITVEEGPDNPTMQAEQFQMIMQLPEPILMQFPPEFIIKASQLRNKDELLKMLEEHQKAQAQAKQEAETLAKTMQEAQVAKVQADASLAKAKTVDTLHGVAQGHANTELDTTERMHKMAMDHATTQNALMPEAEEPQVPQDTGPDPMAVQAQMHQQDMDKTRLALDADNQRHSQLMDIAGHALAIKQANKPQARPAR